MDGFPCFSRCPIVHYSSRGYLPDLDWNQISDTTVAVKVFLNQSGIVTGAEAIRGDPVLRKVAQEMILQWTFDVESLSLPTHAQVIETLIPLHFAKAKQQR